MTASNRSGESARPVSRLCVRERWRVPVAQRGVAFHLLALAQPYSE